MDITEFAEQIVFGKTLEDKLIGPGKLTYNHENYRAPDVSSLRNPARPVGMEMEHGSVGSKGPPHESTLENEQARGQLLHFFANHELLATELMALVLLKFPDAPRQFKQGVLVTLQEEQEHTRMYIQRMKECGVEFGSYPLSGQFWRVVEPMKSPMDFVSRLSLTFEQANLDYSQHFASVFKRIGDDETAALLQKIYEDEITHVQHGLEWFRQWKDPDASDWQAYQNALQFPMSPARGKGPGMAFNRKGRQQAGLTDDFINSMEFFRQSRGRRPTVRWFNPAAEAELAGELSPESDAATVRMLEQLAKDLELVMLTKSKSDDIFLVRQLPSQNLQRELIDAGFAIPEFMQLGDHDDLAIRKPHHFTPWAWTPHCHRLVEPLADTVAIQAPTWDESHEELFRKSWATKKLSEWLAATDSLAEGWLSAETCTGLACSSIEEANLAIEEIGRRGYATAIVKRDLSTAGRGQRRFECKLPLSQHDTAWLRAAIEQQGQHDVAVVVEPELNRVADLSFLWQRNRSGELKYLGWTRPIISKGRRFAGTRLGANKFEDCSKPLVRFLLTDDAAVLKNVARWLEPRIGRELTDRNFEGYFGIDALVEQTPTAKFKIKPLVELNPRMTMGHIALSLEKRLTPGVRGEFRIFTRTEWDKVQNLIEQLPLQTKTKPHKKDKPWQSGVVRLSSPDENTKLVPVVIIGKEGIAAINSRLLLST